MTKLSKILNKKFPECVPIIVNRSEKEINLPEINNKKFIVPYNMILNNFLIAIRSRLTLPPTVSLWLFINDIPLYITSDRIGDIYNKHKNKDDILYITYRGEDFFG